MTTRRQGVCVQLDAAGASTAPRTACLTRDRRHPVTRTSHKHRPRETPPPPATETSHKHHPSETPPPPSDKNLSRAHPSARARRHPVTRTSRKHRPRETPSPPSDKNLSRAPPPARDNRHTSTGDSRQRSIRETLPTEDSNNVSQMAKYTRGFGMSRRKCLANIRPARGQRRPMTVISHGSPSQREIPVMGRKTALGQTDNG